MADASAACLVANMQNAPLWALGLGGRVPTLETRRVHSPPFAGSVLSPGTARGAYNAARCEIARQGTGMRVTSWRDG